MSTIDAAIIKALVEHIGGNPDDIPDDNTWTTMEQSPSLVPASITDTNGKIYIGLENVSKGHSNMIGSRLYIEDINNVVHRLVLVEQTNNEIIFRGIMSKDENVAFENDIILSKTEFEDKEYFIRVYWTSDMYKLDTMRFCDNEIENYNDPIVLKMLLRHCIKKLNLFVE